MDEEKTMGTDPAPFSDDVLEALRGIDARLGALEGRLASIEAGLHADAPRTHAPPGGAAAQGTRVRGHSPGADGGADATVARLDRARHG